MTPSTAPKLIGLAGRLKSGKTTLSAHLVQKGYHRCSFAAILKEMLSIMGFPHSSLYGTVEEKAKEVEAFGVSGRYACQTLGTEWGRALIHTDVWVKALFVNRPTDERLTVIDDVRFSNEVRGIKDRGGVVIGIRRPAEPNVQAPPATHISETFVDSLEVDHWLENDGTIEEACQKLDELLESYVTAGIKEEFDAAMGLKEVA